MTLFPHDVHSPEDLDDLLTTIGTQGIDVLEGPKLPSSALDKKFEEEGEAGEDVELDLTPGALEKTNDPVRMYLREMGTVPLLTREGEVEIAKRIERGQLACSKRSRARPSSSTNSWPWAKISRAASAPSRKWSSSTRKRSPKRSCRTRLKDIHRTIDELHKHYKKAAVLIEKFATSRRRSKAQGSPPLRWTWPASASAVSLRVRKLGFTNAERKRLIDRVNKTVDAMRSLDRQIQNLERQARRHPQRRAEEGISPPAAAAPHRAGKAGERSRSVRSRNSSAPSAKSSRATWMRSRPSANSSRPTSAWWFPSRRSTPTADCSSWT